MNHYAWLLLAMSIWAPPPKYPVGETKEQHALRREQIAHDFYDVAAEPLERPLFAGPRGRLLTAAFMLNWIVEESGGYHLFVDNGKWRGDSKDNTFNGTSWCLGQHNIGGGRTPSWNIKHYRVALPTDPPEEVEIGYTGPELVKNRKKCARATLRAFHHSVQECKKHNIQSTTTIDPDTFSVYASGKCQRMEVTKLRYSRFLSFVKAHPD